MDNGGRTCLHNHVLQRTCDVRDGRIACIEAMLYPMRREGEEDHGNDESDKERWIVSGVDPNIGCSQQVTSFLKLFADNYFE